MDKIRVIKSSMRCFQLGLLAWIPLCGIVFAPMALIGHARTARAAGVEWNAAGAYLRRGYQLAMLSLVYQTLLIFALAIIESVDVDLQPPGGG
jgi:hypothetical protein